MSSVSTSSLFNISSLNTYPFHHLAPKSELEIRFFSASPTYMMHRLHHRPVILIHLRENSSRCFVRSSCWSTFVRFCPHAPPSPSPPPDSPRTPCKARKSVNLSCFVISSRSYQFPHAVVLLQRARLLQKVEDILQDQMSTFGRLRLDHLLFFRRLHLDFIDGAVFSSLTFFH